MKTIKFRARPWGKFGWVNITVEGENEDAVAVVADRLKFAVNHFQVEEWHEESTPKRRIK